MLFTITIRDLDWDHKAIYKGTGIWKREINNFLSSDFLILTLLAKKNTKNVKSGLIGGQERGAVRLCSNNRVYPLINV